MRENGGQSGVRGRRFGIAQHDFRALFRSAKSHAARGHRDDVGIAMSSVSYDKLLAFPASPGSPDYAEWHDGKT